MMIMRAQLASTAIFRYEKMGKYRFHQNAMKRFKIHDALIDSTVTLLAEASGACRPAKSYPLAH
jgi:hypothetical protein